MMFTSLHLTTLRNRYTVLKMHTRIMQTQQMLAFSRFPSQHLEESSSDILGRKKSNWVENLYSQEESSVSFWAALIETQNSDFLTFCLQPDDLSPMSRHAFFWKNCDIRNRVAVQDVLTNAQKDRVNWCRLHLFFDFTNGIFRDD